MNLPQVNNSESARGEPTGGESTESMLNQKQDSEKTQPSINLFSQVKNAWANRKGMGDQHKMRDLAAFLPAALEIQETPPNPLAKWMGRTLMLLFTLGILWACFGHVNIVASAEGKIIPSARIKQIQPLEKAMVQSILVKEGQSVSKGQALIELDSTLTLADESRLNSELHSAQYQLAVSESLLALLDLPIEKQQAVTYATLNLNLKNINPLSSSTTKKTNAIKSPNTSLVGVAAAVPVTAQPQIKAPPQVTVPPAIDSASDAEAILFKRLLWQQWRDYNAQLQSLNSALQKTLSEKAANEEVIIKLEQTLPMINKRTANMKSLHEKNYATETDYLTLEQERIQQTQDLAAERQRTNQLSAGVEEIKQQINALVAQASANQLGQITDTQRQIVSLQEELNKASDLHAKQILYAPVSGQVQQLAINTVGGVVTEAQQLMVIVPDEEKLEVEVTLQNKDVGFVYEGMTSEIKIHTFPFTKYGVIDGQVTNVANDAILDEQQGLIYTMRVAMKNNTIMVNGREVKLMPGMSVTAEVQTDKRRIIEFFLAPLLRYKKEGLRER